ncbi:S9 family peptidase [Phenylobacterium sp.]|uniref:dipeptidyl-peptidase 5 n=1 Tax=Phenylobacterium sp. TaxID=1871053 RepID=UPI0025EAE4FB|nr:S9 family peptidase [Phenylobacterium sp.]
MNRILVAAFAAALSLASAVAAEARPFTQQDLVALDRVTDAHVSPDGRWAVYDLAKLDLAANRRTHSLWGVATDGRSAPVKWADAGTNPRWAADSAAVYYLAKGQVWQVCPGCRTAQPRQVTDLPLEVDSFRIAPDGQHIVVSMAVFPDAEDPAASKARQAEMAKSKASGRSYDKLFVRHWDTWADGTRNHLFALALTEGVATGAPVPLMQGFDGDAPGRPFGGDEDYKITADGQSVVFSARLAGRTEPWSTNFDLYVVHIDASTPPRNVSAANPAWDAGPVSSPSGRFAAHRAMKRPGFEADRFGVMLYDNKTQTVRELDPAWDRSADALAFSGDEKALYVLAGDVQHMRLFAMSTANGTVKPLTGDGHVGGFDVARPKGGDVIVYTKDSLAHPAEVYALKPGGQPVQLTHVADAALAGVEMSAYESFSFAGWNGDRVHGWVVKPYGWKPGAKYPTVMMIHGGPEGSWQDSWSARWNPEVWAGWGYAVVMVDFHGSTGYGQAFTDAISSHWGDRPLEDLQKGWAAAQAKYGWIDGDRACAAGASYGGFMVYWIAGTWQTPFKCLIAHDGVFDNRVMGYATEELWFSEWENGKATPWADPAAYERFNPIDHVADWTRPMLIIHSDKDFRIPVDQGIAAFTALQRKGVPSRFLNFPDENHWVLKPQNSLQWHDTVQAWLAEWIGPGAK